MLTLDIGLDLLSVPVPVILNRFSVKKQDTSTSFHVFYNSSFSTNSTTRHYLTSALEKASLKDPKSNFVTVP